MTTDLSSEFAFRFSTTIENAGTASYVASIAIIPLEIIEQLPSDKRIRVNGRFQNTFHFNLAIQPKRTGEKYLSINASTLKALKLKIGDCILIEFTPTSSDFLIIPEEFETLLLQDDLGRKIFEGFTIGYRRSILHYVSSAKSIDVRIKRSNEILEKAKRGEFGIQKKTNT